MANGSGTGVIRMYQHAEDCSGIAYQDWLHWVVGVLDAELSEGYVVRSDEVVVRRVAFARFVFTRIGNGIRRLD